MATELTVQSERAYQKQPHIFLNSKSKGAKSRKVGKGGRRWYKDVGLGFRTPKTAIEGSYIDKKCPFTGMVSIRGRILTGTVVSTKMHRTLIIRREYLHFVPKYARYEKRHKNLAAHVSPAFRVEEGDTVTVGQCRPLSKTVRGLQICENLPTSEGLILWKFRSDSTFCVSCPEPARLSSRSKSSRRGGSKVPGAVIQCEHAVVASGTNATFRAIEKSTSIRRTIRICRRTEGLFPASQSTDQMKKMFPAY
jgi:small subunit ribosomal protein S11e